MSCASACLLLAREAGIVAGLNSLIALFMHGLGVGSGLGSCLLIAQAVGLSVYPAMRLVPRWLGHWPPLGQFAALAATLALATGLGLAVGSRLAGLDAVLWQPPARFWSIYGASVGFGAAISTVFISRKRLAAARSQAQEERLCRLAREKGLAEMRLVLLQAQIEPHFLFNTLATVDSLLEENPSQARALLQELVTFLRLTMQALRSPDSTVGQELDLVASFLAIFRQRLPDRLRVAIEAPPGLRSRPLPPLLIQPLVENAIRHGIEPAKAGGEVLVRVSESGARLIIEVADTGAGMGQGLPGSGVGLANVRERLAALHGNAASLSLFENRPCGVRAVLEIPWA
ncbi:MAG: histidine kinase [Thermodesulfobacteriota bacterium]